MTARNTQRLTTAQALVEYLKVQFSEMDGARQRLIAGMFGIFGHGNAAGLGQALTECGNGLTLMQPCNEQSMVHTAAAYAKATLRRSTLACAASIGPGSTNMVTGAAAATINCLPVLLLPADYYATRYQGPVLQQVEHPISADVSVNDCFRPVSRFFDRISRPEQLLTALPEAMRVLTDPCDAGTVTICLPQDVQSHAYDYPAHFFEQHVWRIERRLPHPQRIAEVAELLAKAKRPMIIAGGGVHYSQAREELERFSEAFGIPVGETMAGKSAIRNGSELLLGACGITGTSAAADISLAADVVLCIGTRLTDFTTGSHSAFQNHDVRFISLNVRSHDAYKMGAVPVLCDAREGLKALHAALQERGLKPNMEYRKEISAAKTKWAKVVESQIFTQLPNEIMSQAQVLQVLNEEATSGDTVIAAAGSIPADLHQLWDASKERFCHLEFGYSCMGYEIPAGLGVRMAQPAGEVYVFIGDGTYLMNPTEVVTAVQEGLKITIVLTENHGYQVIRRLQLAKTGQGLATEFRKRDPASNSLAGEYLAIDFAQNAASMGAKTWSARTPAEVRHALQAARKEPGTCCIVCEIEKHRFPPGPGLWWDVAPAEVSGDAEVKKLRGEYVSDKGKLQRLYY